MLNPLIRWKPGVLVRYHGSLTALHGLYAARPFTCLGCTDNHDLPGVLKDTARDTVIACVRPSSITPA